MKCVSDYQAYIFDVDGTLYYQHKMRRIMICRLAYYYMRHPDRWKELLWILDFRRKREKLECQKNCLREQYEGIAERWGCSSQQAGEIIEKWILREPLSVIRRCVYQDVLSFIEKEQELGKEVFLYSDYPAAEKAQAIGMKVNRIFDPTYMQINELKPSMKMMNEILNVIEKPVEDILYIGDRMDKDGESAASVYMDYCDIQEFRRKILL